MGVGIADVDDDARFAQQLQDEELARRHERMSIWQQHPPPQAESARRPRRDDHAFALEVADAELARSLADREQRSLMRAERERSARQQSSGKTFLGRVVPLLCLGIAISIPILFITGVISGDDVGDFIDDLGWVDKDPFGDRRPAAGNGTMVPPDDAYRWPNKGRGLSLTILNALDDSWQNMFYKVVEQYEKGEPDSLSLATKRVAVDGAQCTPVDGKLKVCNFEYGRGKGWRGICEVVSEL